MIIPNNQTPANKTLIWYNRERTDLKKSKKGVNYE